MIERLGKKNCEIIMKTDSMDSIKSSTVYVREKWYHRPGNQKKLLRLLKDGYMFKEDRLKYIEEVILYLLRHNKLHVTRETLKENGQHRSNLMKKMFYNYVCKSVRGGDHDKEIPVEVCHIIHTTLPINY